LRSTGSIVAILSLFALIGLVISTESVHTSPVFAWSNGGHFAGKNIQVKELTKAESVVDVIFPQESKAKNIIVFVQPQLQTEQFFNLAAAHSAQPNGGAFSNLKKLVEGSASSLNVPYVTSSESLSENVVEQLSKKVDSVIVLSEDGESKLNVPSVSRKISDFEAPSSGSNLIVVIFKSNDVNGFRADDAVVQNICDKFQSETYVALFVGDVAPTSTSQKRSVTVNSPSMEAFHKRYAQADEVTSSNIWNSDIVSGLIISIPFLIILLCGLKCSFDIQSDIRFENQLQPKKNM